MPVTDIGALSGREAVVVAGGLLFLVGGARAEPICENTNPAARVIQAEGDRFIALGGSENEAFAWRSLDRGRLCQRVRLPPLWVRGAVGAGSLRLALDASVAIAWTLAGGIAYSGDAGATWRRVSDLPGAVDVFSMGDGSIVAAVRMLATAETLRYGEPLRLLRLAHADLGSWEPIAILPERRFPVQVTHSDAGGLLLLDPLGTIRLGPDGRPRDDHSEPALRSADERIRVAVPAGPDRFVIATERMLVSATERAFEPFAAFDPTQSLAIDANDEGIVWFTRPAAIFRGRVDRTGLEAMTVAPRFSGRPARVAASGNLLAIVSLDGDVALSVNAGNAWRTVHLEGIADSDGAVFDVGGNLLVVGGRPGEPASLAVTDGQVIATMIPRERAGVTARDRVPGDLITTPAVGTVGERWVVIDGAVYSSDDEGAHWSTHSLGGESPLLLAAAFRGAGLMVLDVEGRLWRSDDGGSSFRLLGAPDTLRRLVARSVPLRIAWDGVGAITVAARDQVDRSTDGGATWQSTLLPPEAGYGADVVCLPDGRVARRMGVGGSPEPTSLFVEDAVTHRLAPVDDAAMHAVAAMAVDGPWLYVAGPEGSLSRADASRLRAGGTESSE